jgi:hypothetical protein
LLGGTAITMIMDRKLALVMVATLPLIFVIIYSISRKGVPLYSKVQGAVDGMVRVVREDAQGIRAPILLLGGTAITMKDTDGAEILRFTPVNDFSTLVFSGDALVPGEYTLWADGVQMGGVSGAGKDFHGRGPGFERGPGKFEGEPPEGDYQIPEQPGDRSHTQGGMLPPGAVVSDDTELPNQPGGELKTPGEFEQMRPGGDYQVPEQPGVNPEIQGGGFGGQRPGRTDGEIAAVFVIRAGGNYFRSVSPVMTEQ